MNKDTILENSPEEELSIGDLLRTERENKGISKSQLAEIIKVREHVVDALENEEWDKLPARVFIKGFIRSYTIAIGYDTKKALKLFDKCVPSEIGEESPVPLTGSKKKSQTMYYVFPALIILAVLVYFLTVRDKVDNDLESDKTVSTTSSLPAETSSEKSGSHQEESVETFAPDVVKESKNQETITVEPENEMVEQKETSRAKEEEVKVKTDEARPVREIITDETVTMEETSEPETFFNEPAGDMLTLSATVNMETYVRMIVDDNPPKEGVFKPGKNPQWTAERGFEVKVGNAGGIEFEFNGKAFKNLGNIGDVKTFRFPEDFKTNWKEETNLEEE